MSRSGVRAGSTIDRLSRAMLWGGLWPSSIAGVGALVLAGIVRGAPGVAGAAIGILLVLLCSGAVVAVLRWTARSAPVAVMAAAAGGFGAKLLLIVLVLVVFRDVAWVDLQSLGFTLLAGTATWTVGEAVGFARARALVVEPR